MVIGMKTTQPTHNVRTYECACARQFNTFTGSLFYYILSIKMKKFEEQNTIQRRLTITALYYAASIVYCHIHFRIHMQTHSNAHTLTEPLMVVTVIVVVIVVAVIIIVVSSLSQQQTLHTKLWTHVGFSLGINCMQPNVNCTRVPCIQWWWCEW